MQEIVKSKASRNGYFFMQDGTPPHCTNVALQLLTEIFKGRVISRRSEIIWPAHSPDLNYLNFWFWGYVESQLIGKILEISTRRRQLSKALYQPLFRTQLMSPNECQSALKRVVGHSKLYWKQLMRIIYLQNSHIQLLFAANRS